MRTFLPIAVAAVAPWISSYILDFWLMTHQLVLAAHATLLALILVTGGRRAGPATLAFVLCAGLCFGLWNNGGQTIEWERGKAAEGRLHMARSKLWVVLTIGSIAFLAVVLDRSARPRSSADRA